MAPRVVSTEGTRETLRLPGVVAVAGDTDSQPPPEVVLAVAEKFNALPLLVMVRGWLAGVVPPV